MTKECRSEDIGIKSYFLGPQSENADWFLEQWQQTVQHWIQWRKSMFPEDGKAITEQDQLNSNFIQNQKKLSELVKKLHQELEQETPTFTPRYIGHMISDISLPALLGHVTMLFHNPNITSKEVAKVANRIEVEAIAELATMIGYQPTIAKGHFTSGGTVANIEGLWRARYRTDHFISFALYLIENELCPKTDFWKLCHMGWDRYYSYLKIAQQKSLSSEEELKKYSPVLNGPWDSSLMIQKITGLPFKGPVVLVPGNKHFSWQKATSLMGLGETSLWSIGLDENGVLSLDSLKNLVEKAIQEKRPILAVVSVAGTTELGQFDPVDQVQDYLDELESKQGLHIWHHIDAAWGGFFASALGDQSIEQQLSPRTLHALKSFHRANSITIDPHKLGYVPYSCGAFLTKNADCYRVSSFAAPYIQVKDDSPWAYTLEGSRSGNGACAVWLTAKSIGFHSQGMGRFIEKHLIAKNILSDLIKKHQPDWKVLEPSDSNIIALFYVGAKSRCSNAVATNKNHHSLKKINEITLEKYFEIKKGKDFSVSKTSLDLKAQKNLILNNFQKLNLDHNENQNPQPTLSGPSDPMAVKSNGNVAFNIELDAEHLEVLRIVLMNPFLITKETQTHFLEEFIQHLHT